MNIKKIVALGLSSVMLLSSVMVNAAFEYDGESCITSLPTETEIAARQPKVTFTVGEQYTDQQTAASSLSALDATRMKKETGNIYFPLTVTVSDIGELGSGLCIIGDEGVFAGGCMLNAITIKVFNTDIVSSYLDKTSTKIGTKSWSATAGSDNMAYYWQAGSFDASYPSFGDASDPTYTIISENSFTVKYVVGVSKNITRDIVIDADDVTASIDYWVGDEALTEEYGASSAKAVATATNGLTFKAPVAPTPVEDKWSVEINNATGDMAATDDNKVWSVKPSKTGNPANIDKFDLTLTSGEDSIVKSIKTDDLNTIMSAWNTGFEFFIGFENVGNHENVTATWDIAAGTTAIVPTGDAVTAAN